MPGRRESTEAAGRALADLAALVAELDPGRGTDVIAHSLGARVALSALSHAAPGDFRRLILLAAAETRRPARMALTSPAGRTAEVINVTTRENDLFDFLAEWLLAFGFDTALGQGIGAAKANWLALAGPTSARVCTNSSVSPTTSARACWPWRMHAPRSNATRVSQK